jgi:hypothetical protein
MKMTSAFCVSSKPTKVSIVDLMRLSSTLFWCACAIALSVVAVAGKDRNLQTENVFLIVSDGFRWQEVFRGAEQDLMNKTNGGVKHLETLQTNFWRNTPEARRAALLPFLWSEVAQHGQIFGNQDKGSKGTVTNGKKFSYPGYNEMLSGFPDPRIDSNDKKPNPNITVFEWLQGQPRFKKKVVAFGTWDAFPYIFNHERSGIPIWPAWETRFDDGVIHPPAPMLALMRDTTPIFGDMILDSFLLHATLAHLQQQRPRLVFVGFGETDEWAHAGRYDLYLESARNFDRFVQTLWQETQRLPAYRNKTTFILTADHGRGSGLTEWKDHGVKVEGSEGVWLAILGPDTPGLGERTNAAPFTQSQIAATIAALLGQDFHGAFPNSGAPMKEVIAGQNVLSELPPPARRGAVNIPEHN